MVFLLHEVHWAFCKWEPCIWCCKGLSNGTCPKYMHAQSICMPNDVEIWIMLWFWFNKWQPTYILQKKYLNKSKWLMKNLRLTKWNGAYLDPFRMECWWRTNLLSRLGCGCQFHMGIHYTCTQIYNLYITCGMNASTHDMPFLWNDNNNKYWFTTKDKHF